MRPAELADHHSGTTAVVAHAVQWFIAQGMEPDAVCCIYATAPFIQADDLRRAHDMLRSGNWAYVFSASEFEAPILRAFKQQEQGGCEMFFPDQFLTRSQDLPTALHDAGQFYWGRTLSWLQQARMFEPHSCPLVIPRWRVQDIDTPDDWQRAELIFKALGFAPAAPS